MMSLQEAIEEVKRFRGDEIDSHDFDFVDVQYMAKFCAGYATAIATILNAVVKGELK